MADLILYACPVGPLAGAIEAYWAEVAERVGRNTAHDYMPHVTLTGFFDDTPASIRGHVDLLGRLLGEDPPPPRAIEVTGALYRPDFHLLTVESAWCRSLAASFGRSCPTVRVKDWLHVSLAYGFPPGDGPVLEQLGRAGVEPALPAAWELRFYERVPTRGWHLHAAWPVQPLDGSG